MGRDRKVAPKLLPVLCNQVRSVFDGQPLCLQLEAGLQIVGDIHGQYTRDAN